MSNPDTIKVLTTQADLDEVCEACFSEDFISIDTEFHRESTFWPELCLIQLATSSTAVIIDPLSVKFDFSKLQKILLNPHIVKVFHAARQDLEIFTKLFGSPPQNIFDTQIAALALGIGDSISYENLVQHYLKRPIDKSSQFTNWTARPLTQKQLRYALADVTHLNEIYPLMRRQLSDLGRAHWIDEDLHILSDPETYDMSPKRAWQRLKLRRPKREYLAVLARVAEWREVKAQTENRPRRRILKDDAVYEIAEQRPTTREGFERLRAMPRGFINSRLATGLVDAVTQALANPEDYAPPYPRKPQQPQTPAGAPEMLRVLLKAVADDVQAVPRLIANSEDLERIAKGETGTDVRPLNGWRYDVFGKLALELMSGKIALTFANGKVKISKLGPSD